MKSRLNQTLNRAFIVSIALTLWAGPAAAAGRERVYLACDDHTDYYWSADAATYRQAFVEMLDYYLARIDATEREPEPFQARFNCDGNLWLWEYERSKPADQFQRLLRRVQDGHISVPLTPITICYGAMPTEAVLRAMYYAGRIERDHGLRFVTAQPMEDQTMPFGVGSLFAGAGAQYCWMGICNCASRVPDNAAPRRHEIYWWTGLDGRKLLIKWNSFAGNNASLGGYAEARQPSAILDYLDKDAGCSRWKYPLVKAAFGKGWDDLKTLTTEFEETAKAKSNADRLVRNSNEIDFFKDFEATYGANLPSYAAAFGNEWDLYPASMAEVSARIKRSVEKLRAAEALAVLVSIKHPAFTVNRQNARDQAFMNMGLYFNHDWTADGSIIRREQLRDWAKGLAAQIESYVDALQADAVTRLGDLISKNGNVTRFFAFNPLSWARTEVADLPCADSGPVRVIDLTSGEEAPSQRVTVDGRPCLRVLASDVPSVGYKVFEIRREEGKHFSLAAVFDGERLEHSLYRLKVNGRGAIESLVDKSRGNREFAHAIDDRAINDLGSGSGGLTLENAGPVSVTLRAVVSGPLPHTTRITLVRDSPLIRIQNEITQNFHSAGDTPPTWAFGFNLNAPDVWHEEVGAVIRVRLLAAGGHYSPDHARYDWQTLNHFADMSSGGVGITLANSDCLFMKLGNSTLTSLDTMTPQIRVLVGGQVDGKGLGIPDQGGDSHFLQRFGLQTHGAYREADAMRIALAQQNPLITGTVTGTDGSYPEASYVLVNLSDPSVLLWSIKPAEDGIDTAGLALRIWNLSESAVSFNARFPALRIVAAQRATHIETPLGNASVEDGQLKAQAAPHALETFLIRCGR